MDYSELDEQELIKQANAIVDYISACKLQSRLIIGEDSFQLTSACSLNLSPTQKSTIFDLLKSNMREYYDAEPSWVSIYSLFFASEVNF